MFPKLFPITIRTLPTVALTCAMLASACGYRGPLYLPDEGPAGARDDTSSSAAQSGLAAEGDAFGQEQAEENAFDDDLEDEFDEDEFEDDDLPPAGDKG